MITTDLHKQGSLSLFSYRTNTFTSRITPIGKMAGDSPGYSLSLVAETTTGVLLSVERTANSRPGAGSNPTATATGSTNWVATTGGNGVSSGSTGFGGPELPEDVGREGAMMLLQEIYKGGVVDSMHQPLVLQLMVLTPEDVSKVCCTPFLHLCLLKCLILFSLPSLHKSKQVRFGTLTAQSVQVLRLLREAFGVTFKIKQETHVGVSQFASNNNADNNNKRARGDEEKSNNKRSRHNSASEGESESEDDDSENEDIQSDANSGSDQEDDGSDNSDQDEEDGEDSSDEGKTPL